MQFLQTVSTAFGNGVAFLQTVSAAFGYGVAFLQTVSSTFNQAFLFQAITAIFSDALGVGTVVGLFSAALYQAFLFQAITAILSNGAFGVVAVFIFLRTAASQGLAGLNGLGFILWGGLFRSWQGKGTGSQDRHQDGSKDLAFHDGLLLGRAIKWVRS